MAIETEMAPIDVDPFDEREPEFFWPQIKKPQDDDFFSCDDLLAFFSLSPAMLVKNLEGTQRYNTFISKLVDTSKPRIFL